jgi:threonine/homoserine/homoserine lactone efflux protein
MRHRREWWLTVLVVAGIFLGAMLWWTALALLANRFRESFNTRAMLWMNRIAGLAIGGFGVATMAMGVFSTAK